jgi:hypothetical protein
MFRSSWMEPTVSHTESTERFIIETTEFFGTEDTEN